MPFTAIYDNIFAMESFNFNKVINTQYNDLKENYRKIFIAAADSMRAEVDKMKPNVSCNSCPIQCNIQSTDFSIFEEYPNKCPYRDWQLKVLTFLNGDYRQGLLNLQKSIMQKKEEYKCNCCGACCRLAVSEHSYDDLKKMANRGDKFAKQFTSVFLPYQDEMQARSALPEYFELLDSLAQDKKMYFYYCPKCNDDNRCSDYENRPDICKDFPYNPLKMLPSTCGYQQWREEANKLAMSIHAKMDLIEFYKNKLS